MVINTTILFPSNFLLFAVFYVQFYLADCLLVTEDLCFLRWGSAKLN